MVFFMSKSIYHNLGDKIVTRDHGALSKSLPPPNRLELEFAQVIRSQRNGLIDLVRVGSIANGRWPFTSRLASDRAGDSGGPIARRCASVTQLLQRKLTSVGNINRRVE